MRGLVFACLFSCALSSIAEAAQRCNLDENYNVNQRPDPAGQPTDVSLGVTIVDVLSINDLEGTVAIDLLATIEWRDARLLGLKGCRIESRQIWNPGVQMLNTAQYESAAELAVSILDDGVVRGTVRRRGDISNRFRMEEFPFDSRVITLEFLPLDYNIEEVKLTVNEQRARRLTTFSVPDWSIGDLATVVEEVERPLRGGKVPLYRMTLPAQRDPSYYLYKVMLPLIMIVMMSWCVFWIDPEKRAALEQAMASSEALPLDEELDKDYYGIRERFLP